MSISTGPVSADYGLQNSQQRSQKIAQPAVGNSAQGEVSTARAARVPAGVVTAPAAKLAANAKEGVAAKLSTEQTRQSLQEINNMLASMSISVQFEIDPNYKDVIIKVVDQQTDQVILQIPSEDVVRIAKAMDSLKGLLFSQSV